MNSSRTIRWTASALGLGHLPVAPGTWGSAGAALIYGLVRLLGGPLAAPVLGVLTLIATLAGLAVCPAAVLVYGRKDPGEFVMDEVAGLWLTGLLFWAWGPWSAALGVLVAFRLFDVLKPPPVSTAEKLQGGWGVMTDDLVAGVMAAGLLWIVHSLGLNPSF
jgi:phosphatidylglycerophosphatase A